jgi:hypothetical protein
MSPPIQFAELDTLPIFSRRRRSGFGTSSDKMPTNICNRLSDLPNHLPEVKVEQEDTDMEHMVVVNGWRKYLYSNVHYMSYSLCEYDLNTEAYAPISSPSPTPSLREGDTSSQIDELLLSPPAINDNYALDFELARMGTAFTVL